MEQNSFKVNLSTTACMRATAIIEADSQDEAEAQALAYAKDGNVVWKYDGAFTDTIEVDSTDVVGGRSR